MPVHDPNLYTAGGRMSTIFTLAFWKAAGERAIKSAVQGAVTAGIGAAGFDAIHADWQTIGGASLSMAILSIATSLLSDVTTGEGPSLTNSETLADQPSGEGH
jgi:hypothetical protein